MQNLSKKTFIIVKVLYIVDKLWHMTGRAEKKPDRQKGQIGTVRMSESELKLILRLKGRLMATIKWTILALKLNPKLKIA